MHATVSTMPIGPAVATIAAATVPVPPSRTVGPQAGGGDELPFTWRGSPWRLLGPCLFNGLMTLVTLGVYSFWGRTEIRRRMWACVRLDGEPLVYHGSGAELFKGFVAALIVVLLPIFLLSTLLVVTYGHGSSSWGLYQLALFLIVYPVLKALAMYRARRYRLARTSWRGIRGSMTGSSGEFAFLSWATSLLYPLTFGWIAPWRAIYIQRFLIGDTMLGDRKLRMGGATGKLYLTFGLLWVGSVVLAIAAAYGIATIVGPLDQRFSSPIGWAMLSRRQVSGIVAVVFGSMFVWSLISSFYRATLYNMVANATEMHAPDGSGLPTLRFKLVTRGPQLIWLFVTNQIITYASLFVLKPIATARTMRYFVRHLSIVGSFHPHTVRQNPNALSGGEGLAQAFDFDAF